MSLCGHQTTAMTSKLIIYLLAMLTGFSAAQAARPVSATPASVDAAVGQAYAAAVIEVATQAQVRPLPIARVSVVSPVKFRLVGAFSAIVYSTPVLRHDVILG